jgi:transcription elongation factor S-II
VHDKLERKEVDYTPTAFVTLYRCDKCGKSKTTVHELQTRSADEPMTLFITCFNCNHRWRD